MSSTVNQYMLLMLLMLLLLLVLALVLVLVFCTGSGPLSDSENTEPKVTPLSLLALKNGTLVPLPWSSHHDMYTWLPDAVISGSIESTFGVLLKFTLSVNVCPLSLLALKTISRIPV